MGILPFISDGFRTKHNRLLGKRLPDRRYGSGESRNGKFNMASKILLMEYEVLGFVCARWRKEMVDPFFERKDVYWKDVLSSLFGPDNN